MSNYEAIWVCYCTGQMSERQWQEHISDEVFAAWVKRFKEMHYGAMASGY